MMGNKGRQQIQMLTWMTSNITVNNFVSLVVPSVCQRFKIINKLSYIYM